MFYHNMIARSSYRFPAVVLILLNKTDFLRYTSLLSVRYSAFGKACTYIIKGNLQEMRLQE